MDITTIGTNTMETSTGIKNCICKKIETQTNKENCYQILENNKKVYESNEIGVDRIEDKPIPLSEYYNFLGMKKANNHENKEEVYEAVKKLKQKRLI